MKNLDERLDLDNQIKDVVLNYPKNDDDYLFYIRGKNSTGELVLNSAGTVENLGLALFTISTQNSDVMNEMLKLNQAILAYKSQNT